MDGGEKAGEEGKRIPALCRGLAGEPRRPFLLKTSFFERRTSKRWTKSEEMNFSPLGERKGKVRRKRGEITPHRRKHGCIAYSYSSGRVRGGGKSDVNGEEIKRKKRFAPGGFRRGKKKVRRKVHFLSERGG